jgi:DNA recombination protein RmuC
MPIAVAAILIVAGLAGAAIYVGRQLARHLAVFRSETSQALSDRSADVDRRLESLTKTVDSRLGQLDEKVDRRLESSQTTARAIHERLGKVDSAAAQMLERAKDLSRLEQALRPPKARGGFGELLLENLLRDRLPQGAYSIQYTFDSGDRVDAVVRAGGQLLPVDSKFPLDNYQRLVDADGDDERQLHEKAFARDVRGHVDAISSKYIRPEEGTFDFAFMYIPVEAVYYELACGKSASVLEYAHNKRVFAVSPSTFTAYLQVIVLGLRGMQIEQRAHEVMTYVSELTRDFGKFTEDFELVGTHLGRAQTKYADADKRLDKFAGKLERASDDVEETIELEGDPPRAIEAA